MIYDVQGNSLLSAYDVQGTEVNTLYDIDGNEIELGNIYAYSKTTQMYRTLSGNQGFGIYGGYIFQYRNSPYDIKIINIETGSTTYTIPSGLTVHGNDISFSTEKYSSADDFPILYIGNHGLRLDKANLTATEVETLEYASLRQEGESSWVTYGDSFTEDKLYTIGYKSGNYHSGDIFFEIWDISQKVDNENGTWSPSRRISTASHAFVPCIQGAQFHDGLMWAACGISGYGNIYGFDPTTGEIVVTVPCTESGELEGLAWARENEKWFCIYGNRWNNGNYFRIDFSDTPFEESEAST